MSDYPSVRDALRFQQAYCEANGAPITGAICGALATVIDERSLTGRRMLGWTGHPIADALPLRAAAAFHALYRDGRCTPLQALYNGDDADASDAVAAAIAAHDAEIATWLDGPPQTNEPARSALFMAALLTLSDRFGHPFELLELGSSAGLNLLMDRYRYTLGGVAAGPDDAAVQIVPRWKGPPPPDVKVEIASLRGVDQAPFDLSAPGAEQRLLAYVWADQTDRFARTEAAIRLWRADPPRLDRGDAADWLEARLAEPQADATMRAVMHSIVWQYFPPETKARIKHAIAAAGEAATPERPFAWIRYEADRSLGLHELRVRSWPGGEDRHLANAHPHGAWVAWLEG